MSLTKTTLPATLLFAFALGGCAFAGGTEETSSTEPTASTEAAVMAGGGGSASYSCSCGYCTCTGDADCNDMFSSGACQSGPKSAICQINSNDVPRCRCVAAREVDGDDGLIRPRLPIGPILMAP